MGFYQQLDFLVTILTAALVFMGCTFYLALSVTVSLLISGGVFVAGILFGRRIARVLEFLF